MENKKQSTILNRGDLGTSSVQGVVKTAGQVNLLAWKSGILEFEKQPLTQVLDELSDHYNVQIAANKKLGDCLVTIKFDNLTVEECLNKLGKILEFSTSKSESRIKLSGEGC